LQVYCLSFDLRGHRGRDRMVVGFPTTYVISAYRSGRGVQHYVIKFASDLHRSMVFSRSSGFLHQ
jgi:hypothetical protein